MARIPEIPGAALRDHGGAERIERLWQRIEPEITPGAPQSAQAPVWLWVPAALAMVFGAGVFVGAKWVDPGRAPLLTAERPVVVESPASRTAPPVLKPPVESERRPAARARRGRAPEAVEPVELAATAEPVAAQAALSAPEVPPEWEVLAERGDYEAARGALDALGGFSAALERASASQLWTLHDIARASGSRERAITALRRIVQAFPSAQEAPVAAWTLGTLLEQAGNATGAAEAYSLYRRLSPGGDFAEDALAREVDSALSQGNLEHLARLVAQYENEFPHGARLEEFRSELGRRVEQARRAALDASLPADDSDGDDAEPGPNDAAPVDSAKSP